MKTFKQILFVLFLLTIGSVSHAARVCNLGEFSLDCPLNDDPSGVGNILNQGDSAAAQAEAQRQWQIREDDVHARIGEFRNTPSYGAIAASKTNGTAWAGGYKTKEDAAKNALRGIQNGEGKIIATISNTCAGVADLIDSKNNQTIIVATDSNADAAVKKAVYQCEKKYGQENCGVGGGGKAYCTGYDYGFYGK